MESGVSIKQKLAQEYGMVHENLLLKDYSTKVIPKKLVKINYKKTCDCSSNKLNCLTAKEWVKSQVAVWEFFYEKRDIRDKNIHPAVYPIALAAKCIETFTHKGELILDPFVGAGTTLVAAQDLERNAIGFDLKKEYIEVSKKRLMQKRLSESRQLAVWSDALNIPEYLEKETIALCLTSPPYAHMLNKPRHNKSLRGDLRNNGHYNQVQQYSLDVRDLGTMSHEKYAEALTQIYKGVLPLMKPKAHCVINVNDVWWENKRYPTHMYVVEALQKAGFELRNILIWDKRKLVNHVGIFGYPSNYIKLGATFEYILDFWRPE